MCFCFRRWAACWDAYQGSLGVIERQVIAHYGPPKDGAEPFQFIPPAEEGNDMAGLEESNKHHIASAIKETAAAKKLRLQRKAAAGPSLGCKMPSGRGQLTL